MYASSKIYKRQIICLLYSYITGVPIRGKETPETHMHRENTVGGYSEKVAISKSRREALEEQNLLTPWSWTYNLQSSEKYIFIG